MRSTALTSILAFLLVQFGQAVFAQCTPSPPLNLGNDTVFCADSVQLAVSPAYVAITWSTGATTPGITATADGLYFVQITDTAGCAASDSVSLKLPGTPTASVTPAGPLESCEGKRVELNAFGFGIVAYQWSTGATSSNLMPDTSGLYSVIVFDHHGCSDTSSVVSVSYNPLPQPELGPDATFCENDPPILNPGNFAQYLWQDNSVFPTFLPDASGTYRVTVTDSNGCSATDAVDLLKFTVPPVFIGSDTAVCGNQEFAMNAGAGFVSYLWSNGLTTQQITIDASGVYNVQVELTNGCLTVSNDVNVTVLGAPAEPQISFTGGKLLTDAAAAYQWIFDGTPVTGGTAQALVPESRGVYQVRVFDDAGCFATSQPFEVELTLTAADVSEGFSPNGDGNNDVFYIRNLQLYPDNKLKVMNRWGNKVFEQKGYANDWNGRSNGGTPVPDGTYFYILEINAGENVIAGQVTVHR